MKSAKAGSRRDLLKAAGAGLVAAAAPSVMAAEREAGDDSLQANKPVYLWGCGWNRDLPGVFGDVCLAFEMRAMLNGTGVGTFRDDVHPEVNSQWRVDRATRHGNTVGPPGTKRTCGVAGPSGTAVSPRRQIWNALPPSAASLELYVFVSLGAAPRYIRRYIPESERRLAGPARLNDSPHPFDRCLAL